jgi:hypothetical protein
VQVAIVRQTETAALRKASKNTAKDTPKPGSNGSSSSTFSRGVAGLFSPGTAVDEHHHAFRDLVTGDSSSRSSSGGGGAPAVGTSSLRTTGDAGNEEGEIVSRKRSAGDADIDTDAADGDGDNDIEGDEELDGLDDGTADDAAAAAADGGAVVIAEDLWITSVFDSSSSGCSSTSSRGDSSRSSSRGASGGRTATCGGAYCIGAVSINIAAHRVDCLYASAASDSGTDGGGTAGDGEDTAEDTGIIRDRDRDSVVADFLSDLELLKVAMSRGIFLFYFYFYFYFTSSTSFLSLI